MRHHGQMLSIIGAQCSYTFRTSIGIERIRIGDIVRVIHVANGCQVSLLHRVQNCRVGEMESAFSVGHPDSERRAFHSLQHHRWTRLNLHTRETTFEPATIIVEETRLSHFIQLAFGGRNPSQERHELTAIANTQTEGVFSISERLELFVHAFVELDHTSPTFSAVQNISKRESSHKHNASELIQCDAAAQQVADCDVPCFKAGG
mmetsp:Transcript_20825/g.45111  ORF Transcript_20825/g.45111 Transcript_20825/m.45111 type:complete len:205 (+) Transcript_20825:186-800(+)